MTSLLPPITMPQLSGGRERAASLLAPIRARLRGASVRIDCRDLVAGTSSFADELVSIVLVQGGADLLVIEHAGNDFATFIRDASIDHGVSECVRFS